MTIRFLQGDALTVLRTLPDESAHCCVTSPPYFGLRRYLPDGHPDKALEMGSERTPDEFIARLVQVFREVRRVLRRDGVCFVNMGDAYSATGKSGGGKQGAQWEISGAQANGPRGGKWSPAPQGSKPKDLLMMPFRLALALQADGWWIRSAMPWVKRSCMPESCRDRPTSAIEYVFMLAKRPRYFWDADAVRQGAIHAGRVVSYDGTQKNTEHQNRTYPGAAGAREIEVASQRNFRNSDLFFASLEGAPFNPAPYRGKSQKHHDAHGVQNASDVKRRTLAAMAARGVDGNKVADAPDPLGLMLDENGDPLALDVNPAPLKIAHFAAFPPKLVAPLVKAGTSERGCCPACGAPWARVTDKGALQAIPGQGGAGYLLPKAQAAAKDARVKGRSDGWTPNHFFPQQTVGWRQTCGCPAADPIPCTVLDPFSGSGTTLLVADRLRRDAIGIDLSPQYREMATERVTADAPLLTEIRERG